VDSKKVSAELAREVRPLLRERGFQKFTARNAWRIHEDRVDVLNFQSFNDHLASGLGCTTYSFSVNLGCFLRRVDALPALSKVAVLEGRMPKEYECQFRGRLTRTFEQSELPRRDIWYVDPAGIYLPKVVHDVRMVLFREGLDWFEMFSDESRILEILRDQQEESDQLWGFGAPGSPNRTSLIQQLSQRR
jgi:hypothetical protein